MKLVVVVCSVVVLLVGGCREPRSSRPVPDDGDDVCVDAAQAVAVESVEAAGAEAAIDDVVTAGRVAAVGVGIAIGSEPRWLYAAGDADPNATITATVDTPFMLASVTKTVVATAVLQLVERGEIDLDVDVGVQAPILARIRNPAFPDVAITPRMLLTHTSSLFDVRFTFDATWATAGDSPIPMRDFVAGYFEPQSASYGGADMW